ncbi:hypothetical protein L3X38_010228 [Prunus dulcis]|uniref:Uncharacterized protein n=1 Tax=Prunus dulcis TaxID=3755 RepID=A0AAD4ZEK3_PRUDU|nr:hypothetical protein L3X38_010228 [Prunus dulcis]
MALLFKLKSLRLGYSILSSTFASKTKSHLPHKPHVGCLQKLQFQHQEGRVANPRKSRLRLGPCEKPWTALKPSSQSLSGYTQKFLLADPEQTLLTKASVFSSLSEFQRRTLRKPLAFSSADFVNEAWRKRFYPIIFP